MTTYNFTHKDLLDEVVRVAESNPDFVYAGSAGCSYLGREVGDPTGQCCIVGQALQNLGVSKEDLLPMEAIGARNVVQRLLGEEESWSKASYELKTIGLIQNRQDSGSSWGISVNGL